MWYNHFSTYETCEASFEKCSLAKDTIPILIEASGDGECKPQKMAMCYGTVQGKMNGETRWIDDINIYVDKNKCEKPEKISSTCEKSPNKSKCQTESGSKTEDGVDDNDGGKGSEVEDKEKEGDKEDKEETKDGSGSNADNEMNCQLRDIKLLLDAVKPKDKEEDAETKLCE